MSTDSKNIAKNTYVITKSYEIIYALEHKTPIILSIRSVDAQKVIDCVREKITDAEFVIINKSKAIFYTNSFSETAMGLLGVKFKILMESATKHMIAFQKIVNKRDEL